MWQENQKTTPEESKPVQLKTSPVDLHLEDTTRSSLFQYAMSDGWDKVIEIYTRKSVAHCAKITNSGNTALHIAVMDGKKTTVEQLVSLMSIEEAAKALRVKNERGNTPLHLAAFVGNASLCDCLASKIYLDEEFRNSSRNEQDKNNQNSSDKIGAGYEKYCILGERNKENQTPLFLAAVMGKTDAFLCLHSHVLPRYRESYYTGGKSFYTGNKGDTILHVAISGEYFGENIWILTKIKAYMFLLVHKIIVYSLMNHHGLIRAWSIDFLKNFNLIFKPFLFTIELKLAPIYIFLRKV